MDYSEFGTSTGEVLRSSPVALNLRLVFQFIPRPLCMRDSAFCDLDNEDQLDADIEDRPPHREERHRLVKVALATLHPKHQARDISQKAPTFGIQFNSACNAHKNVPSCASNSLKVYSEKQQFCHLQSSSMSAS
jgi:hypothetical protein